MVTVGSLSLFDVCYRVAKIQKDILYGFLLTISKKYNLMGIVFGFPSCDLAASLIIKPILWLKTFQPG
jgi:hypothetical protein